MAVISAFRTAGRTILRNPIVLVVTTLFGAVQLPQLLSRLIDPFLAGVISLVISFIMIFVTPFFQAGLIGMVHEGIDGRTSLGTFVSEGKDHYVSILAIYMRSKPSVAVRDPEGKGRTLSFTFTPDGSLSSD